MDKARRHSLEKSWAQDEEIRDAHSEFLAKRELAAGTPSWRALVGQVVYLSVLGNVVGFQRNSEGEREPEPRVVCRQKVSGKVLAVERAGIWLGPPDESTWNFISFASITSACLRRPDAV